MGGLTKTLFGGSSSKSSSQSTQESGNTNNALLTGIYTPQAQQGVAASSAAGNLLGIGGDPAAAQGAFDNYLNSSGYNFQLDQGQRAVTGSAAAKGLLNSGSTLKALTSYGQNLGSSYFDKYLSQLGAQSAAGQGAGGIIAGAGQYSKGTSNSTGTGSSTGGIIPGIFG